MKQHQQDNNMKLLLRELMSTTEMETDSNLSLEQAGPQHEDANMHSSAVCRSTTLVTVVKPRKSVSFTEQVKVYFIDPSSEYSDEDHHNIWYDRDEFADIKAECFETVRKMAKMQPLDLTTESSRGLEYRTPDGLRRRQQNKLQALDAVLNEQDLQWDNDENDAEMLSLVYLKFSIPSQATAHRIGLQDERYARALLTNIKPVDQIKKPSFLNTSVKTGTRARGRAHHKILYSGRFSPRNIGPASAA